MLSRPQRRALSKLKRGNTITLAWGRGTGKSLFIRLLWYLLVAEWDGKYRPGSPVPGVRIVLLMPTLEQAKKVHARLMIDELEGKWAFLGGQVNRTEWRVSFPGGSWIQWVTAERARNIRGLRCDVICIDECDDIEKEVAKAICQPWLSEPHSLGMMVWAGTPTRGRHGLLYEGFKLGNDGSPGYFAFHTTYRDVPEFVDVDRIERERANISPELFAREWLCDFDAAEGLVYPMFKASFHVRPPHQGVVWSEVLVGVDHGYEHPGAIVVIGVAGSGRDAVCHVLKEVYSRQKTESWWIERAAEIQADYPKAKWFADPSQPARIDALRTEAKVNIVAADNDVDDGVSCVADKLIIRDRPTGPIANFYVDPSCAGLIKEFGLYRRKRDPKNRERVLDDIHKVHDDAQDAVRYALLSRFGKPPAIRIAQGPGI